MKRLIPCLVLLPFLTSCEMTEPEYYEAGYYHSIQPHSEIYGFDERPHDYRHPSHHRNHKMQYGTPNQATVHGHGNDNKKQYGTPNQATVHGHGNDNKKQYGAPNQATVHGHAKEISKHHDHNEQGIVNKNKNKAHGHDKIDMVKQ